MRRFLLAGLIAIATTASAEISYRVRVLPETKQLEVQVRVPVRPNEGTVTFEIPKWAPGSYRYQDFANNVRDFVATSGTGQALAVVHEDKTPTWVVTPPAAGEAVASYRLNADLIGDVAHWSGPATYMYVVGRKDEACRLDVDRPADWPVAVGLEPAGDGFTAPDYDVLADNPVSVGKFIQDTYTVLGKPHFIVIRGETANEVDRELLKKVCEHVTKAQADFFFGLPYNRYVWHFVTSDARDGGWGLEHLTSTQIGLASGLGPGIQKVISHEFFHLWNVKRTRSKPLGPFNYQELPQTGALWFLEGVTDYYAKLLLRRYNWQGDAEFPGSLARTVEQVRRNEQRLKTSPYEASYRVRDANNGRGNSRGYNVDYYPTGLLVGLCLDLELRSITGSRRSLDDVVRALYDLTKDGKAGFEEDEIRKQLIRFGGETMGPFYDRLVMQPGELPVEEQLAKAGLHIAEVTETYANFDFGATPSKAKGGLDVRRVEGAAKDKLVQGDVIVAIDGQSLASMSNMRLAALADQKIAKATPGSSLRLTVKRADVADPIEVVVSSVEAKRTVRTVVPMPNASPDAITVRNKWLNPPMTWEG